MDTRIFVMTHKKVPLVPFEGYELLNVGADLHDDFGCLSDNTGDNISSKNPNYSELTGVYWLWKNMHCDNIGIVHYRRYFIDNGYFLTKEMIDRYLSEYDAILPVSGFRAGLDPVPTIYEHYDQQHFIKDLDTCLEIIKERHPEYVKAYDAAVVHGYFMNTANMWIARKEIFDSYCEWLFDILFEVEKRTDISDYDSYQARIYGFLSERLFRVWLLMQPMKCIDVDVSLIEPEEIIAEINSQN